MKIIKNILEFTIKIDITMTKNLEKKNKTIKGNTITIKKIKKKMIF